MAEEKFSNIAAKPNVNPKLAFLFVKIDRCAAWVLFFAAIAYAITGYGMTKGLISVAAARSAHLGLLGAIALPAFIIHTSWAIHLFFKRKCIWNIFTKIALVSFYIILVLFFAYVHFFYGQTEINKETQKNNIAVTGAMEARTIYTAETLKTFNGLNSQPAYVAVDGVVYDMSKEFRGGKHHGYSAGQDLSAAFHEEHPDNFLNGLTIVGTYQAN